MMKKVPILPDRIRRVPRHFSWIDHRLVRDRYIDGCSHTASALYLFLVTVGDAKGLSYYADATISQRLSMDQTALNEARNNLIRIGLIAWQKPLYQVLALDIEKPAPRNGVDNPLALGKILDEKGRNAKASWIHSKTISFGCWKPIPTRRPRFSSV
jgi:hypothetical protein